MTSTTATRPSVTATLNALVAGQEVRDWTALSASEQAHVRRLIRKRGGQVRATKGVAHAEGLEGDGIVAALTPAPEPTPVPAEPKVSGEVRAALASAKARRDKKAAAQPVPTAPAEELTKIRVGKGFLAYLEAERPNSDSLLEKARTAHRYKDGCSVLELTPGEASALLESAQEAVADAKRTGWTRSAETGAKAILRWMDAAGITDHLS